MQLGQDIDGVADRDLAGSSVSLSADGMVVALGAIWNDNEIPRSTGHVRVFSYSTMADKWIQMGSEIRGDASLDNMGKSVDLSADGTIVAVGADRHDGSNGIDDSGHVRVFRFDGARW